MRRAGLIAPLLLAACTVIPPPRSGPVPGRPVPTTPGAPAPGGGAQAPATPPPPPPTALTVGVSAGPDLAAVPLAGARPGAALRAFAESCRALLVRTDQSGLTRPGDWKPACAAAASWPATDPARFFATWFETLRVSDGRSYVTGYYEPEIAGTRTAQPGFAVPVYRLPSDLVRAWPFETPFEQRVGQPPLGRFD
ncbi:MAG: MltA domain-containing protein, partial [Sphingomonadales bacterium]|nr:MltA domain-containing protein [Sphingomonadales bacterium]